MALTPFLTIWIHPRATIRTIVSENPQLHVVLLASLAGVGETLNRASSRNLGDQCAVTTVVLLVCIAGPIAGLFDLWMWSHLIRWTGKWIGGQASVEHLKAAVAWASTPFVAALPMWIPQFVLFGPELFQKETPRLDAHPLLWIPWVVIGSAQLVAAGWSFLLITHTVAEVQGFRSAWRGLCNVLLSGAVIAVPILLLVLLLLLLLLLKHP